MTHNEFWDLWVNKSCKFKVFYYDNPDADNGELALGEVIAFEYDGKYFLRYARNYAPKGYRKRYKNAGWTDAEICEFKTKENANNFFRKMFPEYRKIAE